jgi:hypothetical protein
MDFVKVEHSLPAESGFYLCVVVDKEDKWLSQEFFDADSNSFKDGYGCIPFHEITHWAEIVFPK